MIKDRSINIGEARANFSELVERAANGEEITISKAGTPQAKLVPVEPISRRPFGLLAHLFTKEEVAQVNKALSETFTEEEWPEFFTDNEL